MAAKILVIDDDAATLAFVKYLLGHRGYRIELADDGEAGLRAAKESQPDLILSDAGIPKIDGCQLAGMLKADDVLRKIPMVAVTASAMPADRERMLAAGFDGYIPKPFVPEKFVSQIEEFLPAGLRAGQEKPQEPAKPANDSKSRYLREMADAFVEKLPDLLAGLHADLNREDFKALRVAAHKMLGTCVFLKEPELIDALRKMEGAIDSKQNEQIEPMLNEVERLAHVAESRLRPTHA